MPMAMVRRPRSKRCSRPWKMAFSMMGCSVSTQKAEPQRETTGTKSSARRSLHSKPIAAEWLNIINKPRPTTANAPV